MSIAAKIFFLLLFSPFLLFLTLLLCTAPEIYNPFWVVSTPARRVFVFLWFQGNIFGVARSNWSGSVRKKSTREKVRARYFGVRAADLVFFQWDFKLHSHRKQNSKLVRLSRHRNTPEGFPFWICLGVTWVVLLVDKTWDSWLMNFMPTCAVLYCIRESVQHQTEDPTNWEPVKNRPPHRCTPESAFSPRCCITFHIAMQTINLPNYLNPKFQWPLVSSKTPRSWRVFS